MSIQLADAVISLELGPGVMPALEKLTAYMTAKQEEAAWVDIMTSRVCIYLVTA
jgi:hypothetical protein